MTGAGKRARTGMTRRVLVWTLVLFVASVLYTEIGVIVETHAVSVPLVNILNDPSLYPGDRFAAQLPDFPSGLWHVVAPAARIVPIWNLLFVLFLLERLFVLYAAGRLARAFAPGSELAQVGAMALFAFAVHTLLGSGTVVERYFEHSGLAIGFVLLAIAAFHESRATAWAFWTAIAFNCTTMAGAFALTYFGAVFLLDPEYRRRWARWSKALALLLVLSLYPILLGLRATGHPLEDRETWLAVSRFRSWPHLYPLEWGTLPFVQAGALLAMLVLFIRSAGDAGPRLRRHALVWSGVAAGWFALAWFGAYVVVSPRILLLQPARATDLWICFATVAIACMGAAAVERVWRREEAPIAGAGRSESGSRGVVSAGIGDASRIGSAVGEDTHDGAAELRDGVAANSGQASSMSQDGWRARLAPVLLIGPFLLWFIDPARFGGPTVWTVAGLCLAALAVPVFWRILFNRGNPRRLALLLTVWVCIAGLVEFADRVSSKGLINGILDGPEPNVREIAAWAKASTPKDAMFFVDPGDAGGWDDWDHFRGLSQRGIFTQWEDGTAINWSPNFAVQWARQLALLGFDVKDENQDIDVGTLDAVFENLRDEDVERIREKVQFRYWVIPSNKRTGFPAVFRSKAWKVVDLQGELVLH